MTLNLARTVTDQGTYFTANNGATGVATAAAPTSYSDTAPWFTIQNTASLGTATPSIYLDWIRLYCTVAGTAGVAIFIKLELDKIVPTGGTLLVPTSPNANSGGVSVAAIRQQPTGIAATSAMRLVVGNQWVTPTQTAVFTVNTEVLLKFGGIDGYASTQLGAAAAGLTRTQSQMPPVVIAPGWCLQVPMIMTLQSAASTWALEAGWVEL